MTIVSLVIVCAAFLFALLPLSRLEVKGFAFLYSVSLVLGIIHGGVSVLFQLIASVLFFLLIALTPIRVVIPRSIVLATTVAFVSLPLAVVFVMLATILLALFVISFIGVVTSRGWFYLGVVLSDSFTHVGINLTGGSLTRPQLRQIKNIGDYRTFTVPVTYISAATVLGFSLGMLIFS